MIKLQISKSKKVLLLQGGRSGEGAEWQKPRGWGHLQKLEAWSACLMATGVIEETQGLLEKPSKTERARDIPRPFPSPLTL